jgi:hypothetical protein
MFVFFNSISKEKIEDELIVKIRMQSYNYAVIEQ